MVIYNNAKISKYLGKLKKYKVQNNEDSENNYKIT